MASHLHGVIDKISQHMPTKFERKGTPTHSSREENPEKTRNKSPEPVPIRSPPPSDFRANDKYTDLRDLDAGEEGQCSVVKSQSTSRIYVRKHTRAPSPPPARRPAHLSPPPATGRRKPLPPEARMLTHLQPHHTNLIRYFGVEPSPHGMERYYIYLEFCSGGDLLDQLKTFRAQSTKSGSTAPAVFTLHVLVSLAHALAYLHHGLRWQKEQSYESSTSKDTIWEAIIHGDIKPDNIFLRHSPNSEIKGLPDIVLGDFGMSRFASQSRGITGTPGYDSPEVRRVADLRETDPFAYERTRDLCIMTTKSDVYQLGLVVYLMATGRHFKVGGDPATIELDDRREVSGVTGFLALVAWCLQPEPKERPECTSSLEEGCLFAVDVMMRQRDALVAKGVVDGLESAWHVLELTNGTA